MFDGWLAFLGLGWREGDLVANQSISLNCKRKQLQFYNLVVVKLDLKGRTRLLTRGPRTIMTNKKSKVASKSHHVLIH